MSHPSSFIPQPSFLRLLYWTFFAPSHYYEHIAAILGEDGNKEGWRNFLAAFKHPAFRRFALNCFWLIVTVGAISGAVGAPLGPGGFSLQRLMIGVMVGVTAGVVFGVAFGVGFNVAFGTAFDMAAGVAFGVAFGMPVGVAFDVAANIAVGVAVGAAASVAFGVAFSGVGGVAGGVVGNMAFGVAFGVVFGVTGGVAVGVAAGVGWIAGWLRLPFYLPQTIASLTLRASNAVTSLRRSPAMWDELMVLPQPRLAAILRAALEADAATGLRACGRIACNPFQRWAAQRALRGWLAAHPDEVYFALWQICLDPEPYRTPAPTNRDERARMKQTDFTARLLLGELVGLSPIPGFSDRFARAMTAPLRDRSPSPLTPLAAAYYYLLVDETWNGESLAAFEPFRRCAHGEETYWTFLTLDDYLKRKTLDALAANTPIYFRESPAELPSTVLVLSSIGPLIQRYRAATTAVGKRDALINAGLAAATVRKRAELIKTPERVLLLRIAEQWLDIINAEQAIVAAPQVVRRIRNMYLVGNPVMPGSGHPFVGRQDQFQTIDNLWRDATLKSPIILHGQRRMGKTSILRHLENSLGPAYISVFANLQILAAVDDTGPFVYNLCDVVQERLSKASIEMPRPQRGDFAAEPYIELRHFLDAVEARLGDRWLVLMLDEFEMIEDKIRGGAIRNDVLYQFRDAMLNRPRLAVVLAGLHTLDEMTRDYWSPFFTGARNVKVSYLEPDAAEELIANPWVDFELEHDHDAINYIANVTGRQPMLLQAVCSALIERINLRLEKEPQFSPRVALRDVEAALGDVPKTTTYFDAVWKELAPDERLLLAALAESQPGQNVPADRADVERRLQPRLSPDEIEAAWDKLSKRDMIDHDDAQAGFRVELVRRWVKSHKLLSDVLKSVTSSQ